MRRFGGFACIDWSGAKGEAQRGIALAACLAGDAPPVLVPPPTGRHWSRKAVLHWLIERAGDDLLVGFDFSAALPFTDGRAYFPGLPGSPPDARSLWARVDAACAADPHLGVDGFVDHPDHAPFFRRHGGREGAAFGGGRGRLRATERHAASGGAASSFNLVGAGQVGRASLSGMRLLHRLEGCVPVWPFDPVPEAGALIVEIYTRIAAVAAGRPRGRSKIRDAAGLDAALSALDSRPHAALPAYDDHRTDALLGAAWLRVAAGDAALWSPAGLEPVRHTEGWTFGVP